MPGSVLRQVDGHIGPMLLVWVVGGVLSLLGALTYAELGAMDPAAGGLTSICEGRSGRSPRSWYGWTFFLVMGSGSAATLAVASTSDLQEFVPLDAVGQKLCAIFLLVIVAAITWRPRGEAPTCRTGAPASRSARCW